MRLFLHKNWFKLTSLFVVVFLVLGLASCRPDVNHWYQKVYTTWGAEFQFTGFWDGFWGWSVSILSYPFAWLCSSLGKVMGNSYFWGIVFTTIIIRTIAFPIYSKQNSMQLKMQILQPELDRLNKKYQFRQDEASQQKMKQEMMMLYKKYKINPMGCLFTSMIQFPIFIAMYEVVKRVNLTTTTVLSNGLIVNTYGKFALDNTMIFGYFELNNTSVTMAPTMHDKVFCVVIALLYAGVTFLSQKLAQRKPSYVKNTTYKATNATDPNKQMRVMNIVMLVMFFMISLSSTALGIYWLIGGIYQIAQSQIGKYLNERKYYKIQAANNNVVLDVKDEKPSKFKNLFKKNK